MIAVPITSAQQGAAPDRLQLRSFLTSLPAAGELSRWAVTGGTQRGGGIIVGDKILLAHDRCASRLSD